MILKKIELIIVIAITLSCNVYGILMEEYSKTENCVTFSPCISEIVNKKNVTKCPGDNPLVELRMDLPQFLEIHCLLANENVYNCLPIMNIGAVTNLIIFKCPILENQPIVAVLKNLAIQKIKVLKFYNSNFGKSLSRQHLSELDGLKKLYLEKDNITSIPDDLFNNVSTIKTLSLSDNKLNLSPSIFKNLQNLWFLDLSYNNLEELGNGTFQHQQLLEHLNLKGNALKNLTKNTFEGLESLLELDLSNNNIEVLQTGVFHHLGNLKILWLNRNRLRELPSEVFVGVTNLINLKLSDNHLTQLLIDLFSNQKKLEYLDLSNNLLVELGDVFENTINLKALSLSGNQFTNISGTLFQHLHQLQILLLDNNNLNFIAINAFNSTSLIGLDLANNHLTDSSLKANLFPKSLNYLKLKNNSLITVLSNWYSIHTTLFNLFELDLSFNNITTFSFNELFSLFHKIKVNLTNNQITEIDLNISLSTNINFSDYITVYIENNPINCDCGISTLVKHLQEPNDKLIEIQPGRLQCSKPPSLVYRQVKALTLNEILCPLSGSNTSCPESCKCYVHQIAVSPIIVDCSNLNLTKIPDLSVIGSMHLIELNISNNNITELPLTNNTSIPEVTKIYASNNSIRNIDVENLPNNIIILEIDNNKLSYLNPTTISRLNNITSLQKLSLSRNSWRCDCESSEFLSFIQNRFKLISDYELIKCEKGASIKTLSQTDLCPQDHIILIAACVALALGLISSIVAVLYYKFNQEIKIWLFAHNLCLWFVTEEELDQDKIYDAFISFSHKDEDFVLKHLMPKLENTPNPYKLCIHHRDWNAGEFIQKQIVKSVQESRKTIVVLSPNFLESHWGRMEFMTAHTNAIEESRKRVIVIMYKEIGNIPNLDPEIKTYISMNTYLKWGDPMFWEKLRYALPHPQKNQKPKKGLVNNGFEKSADEQIELTIPSTTTVLANNHTNSNSCREVHS